MSASSSPIWVFKCIGFPKPLMTLAPCSVLVGSLQGLRYCNTPVQGPPLAGIDSWEVALTAVSTWLVRAQCDTQCGHTNTCLEVPLVSLHAMWAHQYRGHTALPQAYCMYSTVIHIPAVR